MSQPHTLAELAPLPQIPFADLASHAWRLATKRFVDLSLLALLSIGAAQLMAMGLAKFLSAWSASSPGDSLKKVLLSCAIVVLTAFAAILTETAQVVIVFGEVTGVRISPREGLRRVLGRAEPILRAAFLVGLGVIWRAILFVVPGIIYLVATSFYNAVAILEPEALACGWSQRRRSSTGIVAKRRLS
jgi:hypothetical protein